MELDKNVCKQYICIKKYYVYYDLTKKLRRFMIGIVIIN